MEPPILSNSTAAWRKNQRQQLRDNFKTGINLIDPAHQFHGGKVYDEIRGLYDDKYESAYHKIYLKENIEDASLIHLRLGDLGPKSNFPRNGSLQRFVGKDRAEILIKWVHDTYRTPIYLIGSQNAQDVELCRNLLKNCRKHLQVNSIDNFILYNDDVDFDIYLMIKCKKLIIGRSTFSFIPALLHRNTVRAEDWQHLHEMIGSVDCKKIRKIPVAVLGAPTAAL